MIEAGIAFVGTVDDVRRQLETVKEKLNPDWFMILSDQGFLPRDEMKEQLDILGTKIIPEFAHSVSCRISPPFESSLPLREGWGEGSFCRNTSATAAACASSS